MWLIIIHIAKNRKKVKLDIIYNLRIEDKQFLLF